MATIRLQAVGKTYPNGQVAVHGLSLEVADGELIVLVGPSGCGKSTTLRLVAGLETPSSGRICIDEDDVTAVPPQDRDLAMVFQSYALYPHKTVRENLGFGLRMRRTPKALIDERVLAAAQTLGLVELLDRKPAQLSGGERQRVALGRAIVREPRAFLLDEPLSNLDAALRVSTRAELARIQRRLGAAMLYVTHDQEEALTLGDRVAVMHDGCIQQIAPPLELYRRPANLFVAGFIGSPAMNFIRCTIGEEDAPGVLRSPFFTLALAEAVAAPRGEEVDLGIRPQDIDIAPVDGGDLRTTVEVIEPLGSALLVHAVSQAQDERLELRIIAPADAPVREGDRVGLRFRREHLHLFDAGTGRRLNGAMFRILRLGP